MIQTAIDFDAVPRCSVPDSDTLQGKLLRALQSGERLTPISALERFQCFSLSQRMGELRRMGWPITATMIRVPSGKKVAEYSFGTEGQAA